MPLPSYAELNRPADEALPLAWGLWGEGDQLGMLNNITPDCVVAATGLVKRGVRFNLDLPLHTPLGDIAAGSHKVRRGPEQQLFRLHYAGLCVCDDVVTLYPQASSQWDGLTHIGDPQHGFYNGVSDSQVTQRPGTRNGIEHLADFGIATRAVLADLPRYFATIGENWSATGSQVCDAPTLERCLAFQGSRLRKGDVLLVRTGWLAAYRDGNIEKKRAIFADRDYSGLSGGEDMWRLLWDNRLAAVASDNVTVEAWPLKEGEPSLHLAIARLGISLGEMFDLEALAADCAETGNWESFFISKPLNLRGGVGSPPNAMAIR
jgi:hypothetical protein